MQIGTTLALNNPPASGHTLIQLRHRKTLESKSLNHLPRVFRLPQIIPQPDNNLFVLLGSHFSGPHGLIQTLPFSHGGLCFSKQHLGRMRLTVSHLALFAVVRVLAQ